VTFTVESMFLYLTTCLASASTKKENYIFIAAGRTRCVFEEYGHAIALTSAFQTCSFCFPCVSHSIPTVKHSTNTLLLPAPCTLLEIYYKPTKKTPHHYQPQTHTLVKNRAGVQSELP